MIIIYPFDPLYHSAAALQWQAEADMQSQACTTDKQTSAYDHILSRPNSYIGVRYRDLNKVYYRFGADASRVFCCPTYHDFPRISRFLHPQTSAGYRRQHPAEQTLQKRARPPRGPTAQPLSKYKITTLRCRYCSSAPKSSWNPAISLWTSRIPSLKTKGLTPTIPLWT